MNDLARDAAVANANLASNLAALGTPADVPGVRAGTIIHGLMQLAGSCQALHLVILERCMPCKC